MTAEPLRVAVVGAGDWGRQHTRVFSQHPDTAVCAVVGRHRSRVVERAAPYGAAAYVDIDEMLERERPDLVSVCLPNEHHFDTTLRLLEQQVPLLVEKPLVFEMWQAEALLEAAGDLFFAVNFNHRYAEPVLRTQQAIMAGVLGDLVFATWRFGGESSVGSSPDANLIETQCHGLDLLELLCGPISSVMGQFSDRTRPGHRTTLAVALEFANGAVGSLLGTYDSSYAYPDAHRLEINGVEGRAVISDTVRRLTLSRRGDEVSSVWEPGYFNDEARSFAGTFDRHVDALVQALREGAPPPVHARAGWRALILAHAIIRSATDGVRVSTR